MRVKILSIGNSFAQDAIHYLNRIGKADGNQIEVVNMYIGGCPLSRHYRNMLAGDRVYELEYNGHATGFNFAMKEALFARTWNYVTFHQASAYSTVYDNYVPYLPAISDYVKKLVPKAKQFVYETWAYEEGSSRLAGMGYERRVDMYNDVRACYQQAAKDINADGYIPSGALFQRLLEKGVTNLHRDGWHASRGIGRYALGLLWYQTFTGVDITDNAFADFDTPIDEDAVRIIKDTVKEFNGGTV